MVGLNTYKISSAVQNATYYEQLAGHTTEIVSHFCPGLHRSFHRKNYACVYVTCAQRGCLRRLNCRRYKVEASLCEIRIYDVGIYSKMRNVYLEEGFIEGPLEYERQLQRQFKSEIVWSSGQEGNGSVLIAGGSDESDRLCVLKALRLFRKSFRRAIKVMYMCLYSI